MNLYRFNKKEFKIPEDVMELMNKLIENDYKAYVADMSEYSRLSEIILVQMGYKECI